MIAPRTPVVPAFKDDTLGSSPISSLPVELVGEVLLWCSQLDIQHHRRRSFVPSLPSVTEVCSLWRNVAISTPNLWSNIMIYAPSERHIAMTKMFLERSKTSALKIRIEHAAGKHSAELEKEHLEHDTTNTLFDLLIPHLNRWQSIDFVFLHQTQLPLLSLPTEPDAALFLEEVSMTLKSWDPECADLLWSTMHSYEGVKRAMWQGFVPSFGCDCYIPWAQLTDISINFPDVDTCLNILKQCDSLQTLDASFYCDSPCTTLVAQEPIVLDKLETLQISSRIELGVIFDNLTLPALKHLDINRTSASSTDADKLLNLLTRSGCRLEAFSFTAQDAEDEQDESKQDELSAYLSSPLLSSLLSLELTLPSNTAAINLLTHRVDCGRLQYLLPNLTSIFLSIGVPASKSESVEEDVMKMFASRIDYSVGQHREFGHEIYQV